MSRIIILVCYIISVFFTGVLYAEDADRQDVFFITDKSKSFIPDEYSGELDVNGALLSSPCSLDTSEIKLPLQLDNNSVKPRHMLDLKVNECFYGSISNLSNELVDDSYPYLAYIALLLGTDSDSILPLQRIIVREAIKLKNGTNNLYFSLNDMQNKIIFSEHLDKSNISSAKSPSTILTLQINYE